MKRLMSFAQPSSEYQDTHAKLGTVIAGFLNSYLSLKENRKTEFSTNDDR